MPFPRYSSDQRLLYKGEVNHFPVHLNILILLAFTALFQAVGLMALSVIDSTEDDDSNTKIGILYAFAIIQSISFGIAHAVTGVILHL